MFFNLHAHKLKEIRVRTYNTRFFTINFYKFFKKYQIRSFLFSMNLTVVGF
jgi:hypothetical protein